MKKFKYFLAVAFVIFIIILGSGSVFMFETALKSKVSIIDTKLGYKFIAKDPLTEEWVNDLLKTDALKDTFIVAQDGAKLHAIYIKSNIESSNTAILIHGYRDNSIKMLPIGYIYGDLGYNILLPDLRGQGQSDGKYIQMGWKDRLDILEWIETSKNIFGDSINIVLHGISMGAATVMMTAGEDLPANVKCFVEDCGYTSVWSEFEHELKKRYHLSAFPLLYTTSWYCGYKAGWNFKEASSFEQIKKSTKPMFFIHGGADDYVPTKMVYELYDSYNGEKQLWIGENVGHANMYWDDTSRYKEYISDFVSKHMK